MSRRNKEKSPNISGYLVSDLHEISNLKSGAGIRFLNWLLIEECGIHQTTFRPSSEMQFLEGGRNTGLNVLDKLKTALADDPEKYMQIQGPCIYNTFIKEEPSE